MRFLLIFSFIAAVTCSNSNVTDRGHKVTHIVWFEISINNQTIPGRIEFGLFGKVVPITAQNFFMLANKSKGNGYKGSTINCIIKHEYIAGGFWMNGGNYKKDRSAYRVPIFADENFKIKHYGAGWLSSTPYSKNAHTSVFVITLKKLSEFDNVCVVFGKVISGMPIVREISQVPTNGSIPMVNVVISDCGGNLADPPFFVPKTDAIV